MTDAMQQPSPEKPAHRMRKWYEDPLVVPIVFVVFLLDLATKFAARHMLGPRNQWPDWDLPFRLFYTTNSGGAFGLFTGQALTLAVLSLFGVGVLLFIYRQQQTPNPFLRFSLGLQLGGALGNLYERVFFHHVTDFISVGWWPVFNLADSSIVVGIAVLAWFIAFPPKARAPAPTTPVGEPSPAQDPPAAPADGPAQDSTPNAPWVAAPNAPWVAAPDAPWVAAAPGPVAGQDAGEPAPSPESPRETPREPSVG